MANVMKNQENSKKGWLRRLRGFGCRLITEKRGGDA